MSSQPNALQILAVLALREIKIRYKGSLLGPLWAIINPLAMTAATVVVLGFFLHFSPDHTPYPLFVLSGMLTWSFVTGSVTGATRSLIWNRELVTKAAFNKTVIPLAFVAARLFDFFVNLVIFLAIWLALGYRPNIFFFVLPLVIASEVVMVAAAGLVLALANSFWRDIEQGLDFLLFLLFYATPIIYPVTSVPSSWRFLLYINPLALAIESQRLIFFNPSMTSLVYALIAALVSVLIFLMALKIFQKHEPTLADVV